MLGLVDDVIGFGRCGAAQILSHQNTVLRRHVWPHVRVPSRAPLEVARSLMPSDGAIVANGDVGRNATSCLFRCFSVADFGLFVAGHLASIYGSAARFSPATFRVLYASEISGHCGVFLGPRGALVAHDVCLGRLRGGSSPCPPGDTEPRL